MFSQCDAGRQNTSIQQQRKLRGNSSDVSVPTFLTNKAGTKQNQSGPCAAVLLACDVDSGLENTPRSVSGVNASS